MATYSDHTSCCNRSLNDDNGLYIEKFVIFIGYPTSGHGICPMDVHPHMVIANEFNESLGSYVRTELVLTTVSDPKRTIIMAQFCIFFEIQSFQCDQDYFQA